MTELPKIKKRLRSNYYTDEEIEAVLDIFQTNNFDYKKTVEETGLDQRTIKKWVNKKFIDRRAEERLVRIADKQDEPLEVKKERFEKAAADAKEYILEEIIRIIPLARNLDVLSRALLRVHETTQAEVGDPDDQPTEATNILAMVTNQIIHLKNDKNGTKGNRAGRNSKKPARQQGS
jgi:hypothetical protein